MSYITYDSLLDKLYDASFSGMKLGLDNVKLLDRLLRFPSKKFRSIHVAGTNGKGSVSTKIYSSLYFSGYKVGLYTSPHISSFRERIQINGKLTSKKNVVEGLSKIFHLLEKYKIKATFFEIITILAFYVFAKEKVDFAIIETGLGGRLDATNIITPILSIITSISLDHTDILGDTLYKIASEKAGIIKKEVPVIVGPSADISNIKERALQFSSNYIQSKKTDGWYDLENKEIAKAALDYLKNDFFIDEIAINRGIEKRPPCRFEVITSKSLKRPKAIIFDVAHNEKGLESLFSAIRYHYKDCNIRTIFGMSKDKDIKKCSEIILRNSSTIHLVDNSHDRIVPREELLKYFPEDKLFPEKKIQLSVLKAIEQASINDELLLISGSFFIMNDIKNLIK